MAYIYVYVWVVEYEAGAFIMILMRSMRHVR